MNHVFAANGNVGVSLQHDARQDNLEKQTIAFWIYPTSKADGANGTLIAVKNPNGAFNPSLYFSGGVVVEDGVHALPMAFSAYFAAGQYSISASEVPMNQWTHIVATIDKSSTGDKKARIYFNGIETNYFAQDVEGAATDSDEAEGWYLGDSFFGNSFGGSLSDFSQWNRVLLITEITDLANGASPATIGQANLVVYAHIADRVS